MMTYPTRREWELTGRCRVRPGGWKKLVLQVEVKTYIYSACPRYPGADPKKWQAEMRAQGGETLHFRDATWEDMQALQSFELVPAGEIHPAQPWPRR